MALRYAGAYASRNLENRIYESCSNMLKGRTEAVGTAEGKPGSMHTKNRKTIRGVIER